MKSKHVDYCPSLAPEHHIFIKSAVFCTHVVVCCSTYIFIVVIVFTSNTKNVQIAIVWDCSKSNSTIFAIYEGKTGWLFLWWRLYNPVMLLKSFYHYKSRRVNDTNIVKMIYKKRLSTTPHPKTNPIVRYCEKHKCRRLWQSCYSDVCNDMSCIKVTIQSYESNTAHDQTILLCTGDRNIVISHDSLIFQMDTICPNNLQPGQAVVESNGHVGQHIMITRYKNDLSLIILKCVVE